MAYIKSSFKNWQMVTGYLLIAIIVSLLPSISTAQAEPTCKVLDTDIRVNYSGDCLNGLADGNGSASGKDEYTGQFKFGLKQGKGRYKWSNGAVYDGFFESDNLNGKGVLTKANGDRYEGDFVNGKYSGNGTFSDANGARYEGGFVNNKQSGNGITSFANGDRLVGNFLDGRSNGQGTYTFADGRRYVGNFLNGKFNGQGSLSLPRLHKDIDSWWGKGSWVGDLYVISGDFDGHALKSEVVLQAQKSKFCIDNGNGTFTGKDGTIWQICLYGQNWENGKCEGVPKNVSWYEAMNAAKASRFAGQSDWILPNATFLNGSIHPQQCKHPNIPMNVREYRHAPSTLEVSKYFWTGSVNGSTVKVTDSRYVGGYNSVHYDTLKSASDFDKRYDTIQAVFVRNAPESDRTSFAAAMPYVVCDANCIASRKTAQAGRDDAKVVEGEKWRADMREKFFGGGSSSGSSSGSSANLKVDWTITSEENGGGLAHWYTKKYYGKCTSGRKSGEGFAIHFLKPSGKYQEVYGSVKNSLADAARDACS